MGKTRKDRKKYDEKQAPSKKFKKKEPRLYPSRLFIIDPDLEFLYHSDD